VNSGALYNWDAIEEKNIPQIFHFMTTLCSPIWCCEGSSSAHLLKASIVWRC